MKLTFYSNWNKKERRETFIINVSLKKNNKVVTVVGYETYFYPRVKPEKRDVYSF